MAATLATVPQFCKGETVRFVGGVGTIKSYQLEAGNWLYAIEMAMGPEPETGRIGYETTILLSETELLSPIGILSSEVAVSA